MAGAPRKYDPVALEREYVTSKISIRKLADKHGVSFSSVAAFARRQDWQGKKVAYESALSRRGYEAMAADIAAQEGAIRDESITVLRATLRVYAQKLANGDVNVNTKDAVEAVKALAILLSEPDGGIRRDSTVIDGRTVSKPDADILRRVADAARGRIANGPLLAGAAPPGTERTRPN